MNTVTVRSYTRQKAKKPEVYISKHDQLRAEVAAMARVNEMRDEIGWEPGPNALLLIAGKLKVLAARLVSP